MENLSKKKKSSSSSSSFNKLPDDTIFSIIRSGTFMDNLSLLHINRRLRKLFIDYYSRPNILKNLSLSELFTLHKKLQKTKTTQFTVEYNRINDIATNFMENMRISELKKLIKDGTITVAASELIKMKIDKYKSDNMNYFYPPNIAGLSPRASKIHSNLHKLEELLDKKSQTHSLHTSPSDNYNYYIDDYGNRINSQGELID